MDVAGLRQVSHLAVMMDVACQVAMVVDDQLATVGHAFAVICAANLVVAIFHKMSGRDIDILKRKVFDSCELYFSLTFFISLGFDGK